MTDFRRVVRVSGPPSFRLSRIGLWLIGVFVLSCFSTAVAVVSRPSQPDAAATVVFFSLLGSIFVVAVLLVAAIAGYQVQAARERNQGYTWQSDQFRNLDQIDPASYVVIRPAGDEYLSEVERKSRQMQARAWAAKNPVAP
ncbi:hypothetical protein KNO15_19315 [Leifsonia shinshuensis]|uniref:hypothetical protein n=1 Tax=Leifsonia shinshuensis TaxID=150026 RepID=UPI001F50DBAD|nr:hypothetical protein [Leifsonia shinshuensis]MCI0158856.1 hypothetical protein [Leifsonia shinshuensis]